MTEKPAMTSGQSKVTSFIVITSRLEFNSTCRKRETFPMPLKYIDVTRATHTNLDVLQEKRIRRSLECRCKQAFVRFLERIQRVHSIERKNLQRDVCRPEEQLTKIQVTTRLDYFVARNLVLACQKAAHKKRRSGNGRLKQPKLDNARRLRGINFIDPEDEEYPENHKRNAMEKVGGSY